MVNEVNIGNVLSEESHYKVLAVDSLTGAIKATHCESGEEVTINSDYVKKFLNSADEFTEIVKVTKEDKLDGTPGIEVSLKASIPQKSLQSLSQSRPRTRQRGKLHKKRTLK